MLKDLRHVTLNQVLKKKFFENMDSFHLPHNRVLWRIIINTIMKFNITERASFFETST